MATKGAVSMLSPERPLPGEPVTAQHYHRDLYLPKLADTRVDAWFAVLRDPVDRLVSEYRFRLRRRAGLHALDPRIWFGHWPVKLDGRNRRMSFADWVDAVFAACRRDPCVNDNHIRPQADFVCEGMTLFAFEDGLDPVFRWIDAQTDGAPSGGRFEAKRSTGVRPAIPSALRERVLEFYSEDVALLSRLHSRGPEIA
jgi:hypothetical protein